ncbi:hypothetical protein BaRGS_00014824 [Batillaria attramentaria]|uniref:Uncharacterized protein n=1 Tax=Batillaria attramentaria TaxID=370345 RepID=A0ABD0L3N2_9CAEN
MISLKRHVHINSQPLNDFFNLPSLAEHLTIHYTKRAGQREVLLDNGSPATFVQRGYLFPRHNGTGQRQGKVKVDTSGPGLEALEMGESPILSCCAFCYASPILYAGHWSGTIGFGVVSLEHGSCWKGLSVSILSCHATIMTETTAKIGPSCSDFFGSCVSCGHTVIGLQTGLV